jgi:hypothetical protein
MDPWDLTDEQLEEQFRAAKAEIGDEPVLETELDTVPEEVQDYDDQDNLAVEEGSDHDGVEEEAVEEVTTESEETEGGLDGEPEVEGDQTEEVAEDTAETEAQPVQKLKYKANGKEYEFTPDEIMKRFPQVFGQAMDYTRKMQQIKPWRQTIDAIEQAKLNHDDVNLMIDVLKGDKDAIAAVLKRTGVDTLDLDVDGSKYVPKNYGRDEQALAIKDVVDEISRDPEYEVTHTVLSKQWDDASWAEMSKQPGMIKDLHVDVKTGLYQVIQPLAEKIKLYDGPGSGKSDLDYYKMAAVEHFKQVQQQELAKQSQLQAQQAKAVTAQQTQKVASVKQAEVKRKATAAASEKRKAAAPTKVGSGKPSGVTDYLSDSEEDFESWYANLQNSQ